MRKRLMRLTGVVTVVAIVLFGLPLAYGLTRFFLTDQHRQLQDQARNVATAVSGDGGLRRLTPNLKADWAAQFSVYDGNGRNIDGPDNAEATTLVSAALRGNINETTVQGRLTVAVPVTDGDVVVGAVVESVADGPLLTRIGITWAAIIVLAVVALGLTRLMARRQTKALTQPLERLAMAAERLGDGDFTVHTTPVGIAEIDSLNDSINRTAARLGAMLERERSYTADASHQLRTPLTGLRLQLEATLARPDLDPREAIAQALVSADRLEKTIADLLALARDSPRTGVELDVDSLTEATRERWHSLLAASGRPLRISIARPLPTSAASPAAVLQILDVLIDNAVRHGRGAVTVSVRSAVDTLAIDVSNEGPPISDDNAHRLFRPGPVTNGHGIGLGMARRLAVGQGGRLTLIARTPTFTLLLPHPVPKGDRPDDSGDTGIHPSTAPLCE